jgi:hypothetical protein
MGWWSHIHIEEYLNYTCTCRTASALPCTLNHNTQTSPMALSTLDWMTAKNAPKRAPMLAARINTTTRQEQHRCGCLAQHPLGFAGPSATFLISVPWWLCSSESDILRDTAWPRLSNQFSHQWPTSTRCHHTRTTPMLVLYMIRWSAALIARVRVVHGSPEYIITRVTLGVGVLAQRVTYASNVFVRMRKD